MRSRGKYRITKFFGLWIVDHPLGNENVFFTNPRFRSFRMACRFIAECYAIEQAVYAEIHPKLRQLDAAMWQADVQQQQRRLQRALVAQR